MNAQNYQEVYAAVSAMLQNLCLQGVRGVATFGDVTPDAESFAKSIQVAFAQDQVEELTRAHPGQAATFLTMLAQIRDELHTIVEKPVEEMTDLPKICALSAEAVLYAVMARKHARKNGGSESYLFFPKD